MGDLISRQTAIDALDVLCQEHRYKIPGKRETYSQYNEAWQDALGRAEGAIGNLPSAQPKWIPCSEKGAEYPCLACDVFGQIFITDGGIVKINGECYDGTGFDFSNAEEFLKGIKVGNAMRMLPRKIVAWMPLPEPYKGGEHETD